MCETVTAELLAQALGRRTRPADAQDALNEVLADTEACRELLGLLGAGTQLEALRQIRDGRTPCRECHRPHQEQVSVTSEGDRITTWRDLIDGHPYRSLTPAEVAAMALSDGVSPPADETVEL